MIGMIVVVVRHALWVFANKVQAACAEVAIRRQHELPSDGGVIGDARFQIRMLQVLAAVEQVC